MAAQPSVVAFPSSSQPFPRSSSGASEKDRHSETINETAQHTQQHSHLPTPAPSPVKLRKKKASSTGSSSQSGSGGAVDGFIRAGPVTPPPDYAEPIVPKFKFDDSPHSPPTPPTASTSYSTSSTSSSSSSPSTTRYSSVRETTTSYLNAPASAGGSASGHRRTYSQTTTTRRTEKTSYRVSVSTWDNSDDDDDAPFSPSGFGSAAGGAGTLPRAAGARFHSLGSRNSSPLPPISSLRGRSTSSSSSRTRPTVLNNSSPHRANAESPRRAGGSSSGGGASGPSSGMRDGGRRTASMFASSTSSAKSGPSGIASFFSSSTGRKPSQKSGRSHSVGSASRAAAGAARGAKAGSGDFRVGIGGTIGGRSALSVFGPDAVTTLTTTTLPYVKPVMDLFLFLVISAITCLSVSAVLFASFSLTFYDDFRRGVGASRRNVAGSIEGVRAGVGRMLGGAKEALDLVSWAAGATRTRLGNGSEASSIASEEEEDEGEKERTKEGRKSSSSPNSRARGRFASSASNEKPTGKTKPQAKPKPVRTASSESQTAADDWSSDSDAQPYDVPPSTPYPSRPASPGPAGSEGSPKSKNQMPPRPPLKVLVPSVVFALIYTVIKLCWGWWSVGPKAGEEARRGRAQRGRG